MERARFCVMLLALAGCDKMVHLDNELQNGILLRAGFHPMPQVEAQSLGGLPPGQFVHRPDGRVLYAAPKTCDCVYEGTEADFQRLEAQQPR